MDDAQDLSQDDSNASDVMESLGVNPEKSNSGNEAESGSLAKDSDPLAVKKRLGMQAKRHQREMRSMQEQIANLQSQIGSPNQANNNDASSYMTPPGSPGMSIEEQIQRGVRFALQAKEEQERKAQEAERMSHVHRRMQNLNSEFDKASEKYEDFDDIVRGDDVPFTASMRDALLLVDNPADVAYKLGKNRDELSRISKLHPLDQAREVNKLAFALMGGNGSAPDRKQANPMSPIKANPVTSSANNSAASIRARMKAGTWK